MPTIEEARALVSIQEMARTMKRIANALEILALVQGETNLAGIHDNSATKIMARMLAIKEEPRP
jgi:hypothetical protein